MRLERMRRLRGGPRLLWRASQLCLCAAGAALVGWVDRVAGRDVSLMLFYLVPVGLAAWNLGAAAGAGIALFSAALWFLGDRDTSGYTRPAVALNAVTELAFYLAVSWLLAALAGALRRERRLARTDTLTGLDNRREFYLRLAEVQRRRAKDGGAFAMLYMDLDGFKQVNDTRGHEVGDQVLVEVAAGMLAAAGPGETAARLGGDEFALLWSEQPGRAEALLEDLHRRMNAHGWPVTVSAGELVCSDPALDCDEAVRRADRLMYEVKRGGKQGLRREHAYPPSKPLAA